MRSNIVIVLLLLSLSLSGQELDKHKWKNRLIVIITDDLNSVVCRKQMSSFRCELEKIKERKLIIYRIIPESNRIFAHPNEHRIQNDKVYKKYKKTNEAFEIFLIGLDGKEKLRQTEFLSTQKLFTIIDGMPMRRAEINSKN